MTHWIRREHCLRDDEYQCSDCALMFAKPTRTCPHCGAVMYNGQGDFVVREDEENTENGDKS